MKDRNGRTFGQFGGEARGVRLGRVGGESDQVVHDDVNASADVEAPDPGEIEHLGEDALPGEGGVAVHDDGEHGLLAAGSDVNLLGAGAAENNGVHGLKMTGVREDRKSVV